jgi:hypothetical protein
VINNTKTRLGIFFDSIIDVKNQLYYPKRIFRPNTIVRTLVTSIKSGCHDDGVQYDVVSNYVISSLAKRIDRLCADYIGCLEADLVDVENYRVFLLTFVEAIFFFYTVQPTVSASFHVGRAVLVAWNFFKAHMPDSTLSFVGFVQRWVDQLLRQHQSTAVDKRGVRVEVEFLNISLVMSELDTFRALDDSVMSDGIFSSFRDDYFTLISCLFCVRDDPAYDHLRSRTISKIETILGDCESVATKSSDFHLAFDTICCPYVPIAVRKEILRRVRRANSLPTRTSPELTQDVADMEANPWFINWRKIDLLNMIRKKELSSVY